MWLVNDGSKQWSVVTILAIGLVGCTALGGSNDGSSLQPDGAINTSTIAAIKQTPQLNAIVHIKGQVGSSAPLLGKTAYELRDATGSIWVLTTHTLPNPGDEVMLKGKLLYQSIQLNGKEQGAIYMEQQ